MDQTRKLWMGLIALLLSSFALLLWMGGEIHRQSPPMPERVVAANGEVLFTRKDIETGRVVWQSFGGHQLGSIWGHGALVAPDWSADWLHRETEAWLRIRASSERGIAYDKLSAGDQAKLQIDLRPELRGNTYDAATGTITVSNQRAQAISETAAHYRSLFGNDPATDALRETYAMRNNTVDTDEHRRQLAAFFFWTSWTAGTERPGASAT